MAPTNAPAPFASLVGEHARAVGAYLRTRAPRDEAEDLLQETLLAALRAYRDFDGASPRAWLLTIARNKSVDARRARARRPGTLADPDELPAPTPAATRLDGELWRSVAALPPKQREAVVLRFAGDLRFREVAAAMGCSEAAARRSVHEGLARLRKTDTIDREDAA